MYIEICFSDSVRAQGAIGPVLGIRPLRATYSAIDYKMRNENAVRSQLARSTLCQTAKRKFSFAAFSVIDGFLSIVVAVHGARAHERWGLLLVNGLLGIAIGIAAALLPGITVLVFVLLVAAWALLSGALLFVAALSLQISHGRWLLVFGGIVSMLYGWLLFASPLIGAVVLTWWLGAYALIFGCTLMVLALRLRRYRGEHVPAGMTTFV